MSTQNKSALKQSLETHRLQGIVESIYKISLNLPSEEVYRLQGIVESIYKISLNLPSEEVYRLQGIVESIYKISLNLPSEEVYRLQGIVESIYKISLNLPSENLLDYLIDLKRIIKTASKNSQIKESADYIERYSSRGQLKSKIWLIETLKELKRLDMGVVFLCAGWCGLLAYFLLKESSFKINQIFNFDIDPLSVGISEDLNRDFVKQKWRFKATLKNILDLNYSTAEFETLKKNGAKQKLFVEPDTIINTSCEHIKEFSDWWGRIPEKKIVILQNNNFFTEADHVNCVSSLEEFKTKATMDFIFSGELDLGEYKRFMLIGMKSA